MSLFSGSQLALFNILGMSIIYKLNKVGLNLQPWLVPTLMSGPSSPLEYTVAIHTL
jgi:hypothetical protein